MREERPRPASIAAASVAAFFIATGGTGALQLLFVWLEHTRSLQLWRVWSKLRVLFGIGVGHGVLYQLHVHVRLCCQSLYHTLFTAPAATALANSATHTTPHFAALATPRMHRRGVSILRNQVHEAQISVQDLDQVG